MLNAASSRARGSHQETVANPMSQGCPSMAIIESHACEVYSSALQRSPLGICSSSVKKVSDARKRKKASTGLKNRFPTMVNSERGSPHQMSRGIEIIVIKSWSCRARSNQFLNAVICFITSLCSLGKFLRMSVWCRFEFYEYVCAGEYFFIEVS